MSSFKTATAGYSVADMQRALEARIKLVVEAFLSPSTGTHRPVDIQLLHELGTGLTGSTIEESRWLPPSFRPTLVTVKSEVIARGANALHSPEYLAVVRRRKAKSLADAILGLSKHSSRDDFAACTYPVVKQCNELIAILMNAEREGNTREFLRRVRNTFLNGGWNMYRDRNTREAVAAALQRLSCADYVEPEEAEGVFNALYALGLDPAGGHQFELDGEEESSDAEDKVSS
jgi:hypothetical protein